MVGQKRVASKFEHPNGSHRHASDSDVLRQPKSNDTSPELSVLKLQSTIGNKAVQRLLSCTHASASIQRAPKNKPVEKPNDEKAKSVALLSLEGTKKSLKGDSKIPGHEGKYEIKSYHFVPHSPMGPGTGGNANRKNASNDMDLSIIKKIDDSSAALYEAAQTGISFKLELLSGTLETGGTFKQIAKFSSDNMVIAYSSLSSDGDSSLEVITFAPNDAQPENKK